MTDRSTYDSGTDVIVCSPEFEPTVRRGVVEKDYGEDVDVLFSTDPNTREIDNERTVTVLKGQVISVDADDEELANTMELFQVDYGANW